MVPALKWLSVLLLTAGCVASHASSDACELIGTPVTVAVTDSAHPWNALQLQATADRVVIGVTESVAGDSRVVALAVDPFGTIVSGPHEIAPGRLDAVVPAHDGIDAFIAEPDDECSLLPIDSNGMRAGDGIALSTMPCPIRCAGRVAGATLLLGDHDDAGVSAATLGPDNVTISTFHVPGRYCSTPFPGPEGGFVVAGSDGRSSRLSTVDEAGGIADTRITASIDDGEDLLATLPVAANQLAVIVHHPLRDEVRFELHGNGGKIDEVAREAWPVLTAFAPSSDAPSLVAVSYVSGTGEHVVSAIAVTAQGFEELQIFDRTTGGLAAASLGAGRYLVGWIRDNEIRVQPLRCM